MKKMHHFSLPRAMMEPAASALHLCCLNLEGTHFDSINVRYLAKLMHFFEYLFWRKFALIHYQKHPGSKWLLPEYERSLLSTCSRWDPPLWT